MKAIEKKYKELKKVDFSGGATSLWLVKRRLQNRDAHYTVLKVETESKLKKKLKKVILSQLATHSHIEEYSFISDDQDGKVHALDSAEAGFNVIQSEIDNGTETARVTKYEDLLDSWAYVIKIQKDGHSFYGVRKISTINSTKKVGNLTNFLFQNNVLIDLDEQQVFSIDLHIDFFAYDNTVFVLNKHNFESALNFRAGMEQKRDIVLGEMTEMKIFSDMGPFSRVIGNNVNLLKKIAAVQKNGYYKNPDFMKKLIELNVSEGWGLIIDNGVIIAQDEKVELILTLLNNSRLKSPINEEVFDVTVKKKVG